MLEEKVADLANRVKMLENLSGRIPREAWRELMGSQENDELFREAAQFGAEWRTRANSEGR